MKYLYHFNRIPQFLFLALFSFFFAGNIYAQKNSTLNVEIFVSCVEDLGNGSYLAHFGYDNPNLETVTVARKKSFLAYNYSREIKYVLNTFEPGLHEKVFSEEFVGDDWVRWTVNFGSNNQKKTTANSFSDRCVAELDVIPYYGPPDGGKVYNTKIDAALNWLNTTYVADPANFSAESDYVFHIEGSRVFIEVQAEQGQYADMLAAITILGFDELTSNPETERATGWFEIGDLLQLNDVVSLNFAWPVYPGIGNYVVPPTGLVNSQGDRAMRSDFARLGFEIDGSGIKIGVLSNSYNSLGKAAEDVGNGDLPGATNPNGYLSEVHVVQDVLPAYGTLSDEGRAMLQIIHDIAPGAELAFRTGFLGEQDMATGIEELAAAGCDVIVDDLTYITEPFFRDGVISRTIDQVVNNGVVFFSSAGNFGSASYSGTFTSMPSPSSINGVVHDFGGSDFLQGVELAEGTYTLVLQWDDGSHPDMLTTETDLDLFLADDAANSLLGFNRENIGGFPIEVIPFSVEGDTVLSNIVVAKAAGPDVPVTFKYIVFRGGSQFRMLEHVQGTSTIVGHPNAEGAIAVGAVRYDKNPVYSPGTYPTPVIMSFSSTGGTPVNGVLRNKPDIAAPNGINTTVDLGNGDWDGDADAYPNFFGTSAASPHAAAVAALIMEARTKFDPGNPLDPAGIRSLMRNTAMDMDVPGVDYSSGSGFIRADQAILTFANPSPHVENLIPDPDGGVPGESLDSVSFNVNGDFFIDDTEVVLRGDPLTEGVVVEDEQNINVDHSGFLGNPIVQAYNPPISASGLDGGFSDSTFFSDPIRQRVLIAAGGALKKYGELLPEFTSEITIITHEDDTLTIEDAVLQTVVTQEEADRFNEISYQVPADAGSNAGEYIIQPALVVNDPITELDIAIDEKYNLEYQNGSLVVEKLALKITPMDMEITYGQELPAEGLGFHYVIEDSTALVFDPSSILGSVEIEHTTALSNEISLVRGVALVNGIPVIRGTALVNGVSMIRGTALVNGTEVSVEISGADTTVWVGGEVLTSGSQLIRGMALVNGLPFINAGSIIRGVALVNGNEVSYEDGYMTALNGEALTSGVPAVRGLALVNGEAMVDGLQILAEGGLTTIDGQPVPADGIVVQNGITLIRGTALVNSSHFIRGTALVNNLQVPIENGIPDVRGLALVNGIAMIRGTALVNNLEVDVLDGEITEVREDGSVLNGIALANGVGFIRGTALVNGNSLIRGTALVNGLALPDDSGYSDDVVNLEDMNLMASGTALLNGTMPSLRGTALVNGLEGLDGQALKVAAGTIQPDGSIVYENASSIRGLALVNGLNYIRGTALVNSEPLLNGNPIVNGSSISENSNRGSILVFDATDLSAEAEELSFDPISFITGTTAGQHWIVPGTYISNNFEITYGLGTLTINPAEASVTADEQNKTYGDPDPELSYVASELYGTDQWTGNLDREDGEDAGVYEILQGSLDAGENYQVDYTSADLSILPTALLISAVAADKVYDGTVEAAVTLSDNRLAGDSLEFSYESAVFEDKNVGENKQVIVSGILVSGSDSANYQANVSAEDSASISTKGLVIGITAEDKVYDGTAEAVTSAFISDGLVEGDAVDVNSSGGVFENKNVGTFKEVNADVSSSGADAGNYLANLEAVATASILPLEVSVIPVDTFLYIRERDQAPPFEFDHAGTLPGDDVSINYTVLRNTDGLGYDPSSDESAGSYIVTPVAVSANYIFIAEAATLHVNPYGPGTRAIKPVLNCVREITPGLFVANLEYDNRNDAAVYIPVGPDNILEGSGIDWASSDNQPVMFLPGGDDILVFFDGTDLSWTVSSLDEGHKASNAANANSSSTKCKKNSYKSASVGETGLEEELPVSVELLAYPNPVRDKLYLEGEGIGTYQMITVYDLAGAQFYVSAGIASENKVELDLSSLPPGAYLVRVVMEDQATLFQVIRH